MLMYISQLYKTSNCRLFKELIFLHDLQLFKEIYTAGTIQIKIQAQTDMLIHNRSN